MNSKTKSILKIFKGMFIYFRPFEEDVEYLENQITELEEKVKYVKDMGLEFAVMKTSKNPKGFIQHYYREGSTLHRINQEWQTYYADNLKLESQLPESMKHCTIQFKECKVGHGRLTATNWVPSDCDTCKIKELEKRLKRCSKQTYCTICGNTLDGYKPKKNKEKSDKITELETKVNGFEQRIVKLLDEYKSKIKDSEFLLDVSTEDRDKAKHEFGRGSDEHMYETNKLKIRQGNNQTLIQARVDIDSLLTEEPKDV